MSKAERERERPAQSVTTAYTSRGHVANPGARGIARSVGGTIKRAAVTFGTILGTLGLVSVANALTAGSVNQWFGLVPRTQHGAWGILLHPLLHANAAHLAMNAVGIVLMGGTIFLRSERDFWRVTVLGILVGGGATWLLGRPALHVGASGVVFAYFGYLLTTGWFDRKLTSIVLSLGAAALWGSALWGLSPLQRGISWELHLFGLIGGVLGAWWRKRTSGVNHQKPPLRFGVGRVSFFGVCLVIAALLRLLALRPLLTMGILGIPVMLLIAIGLFTVIALKALVFIVLPAAVVIWLVRKAYKSARSREQYSGGASI